jgi:hypothetical protein
MGEIKAFMQKYQQIPRRIFNARLAKRKLPLSNGFVGHCRFGTANMKIQSAAPGNFIAGVTGFLKLMRFIFHRQPSTPSSR